jgi:hypothetical protein
MKAPGKAALGIYLHATRVRKSPLSPLREQKANTRAKGEEGVIEKIERRENGLWYPGIQKQR